jgi:hypothetical protein
LIGCLEVELVLLVVERCVDMVIRNKGLC